MREVVLRLEAERPGHLEARADTLPIHISAPSTGGAAARGPRTPPLIWDV